MKPSELIEKGWTQKAYARDKYGQGVSEDSENAVSFCARGAILRCYPGLYNVYVTDRLEKHLSVGSVAKWNDADERTQAEVVAALRAIGE